jgi:hypothetical protein
LKPENAISCILNIQICSKIYANYTCIWNKRRKKRTKNIIIISYNNLSLLSGRQTLYVKKGPETFLLSAHIFFDDR